MRTRAIALITAFLSPFLMASSCHDKSCEGAICTAIFASIMVKVETGEQVPVQLDEVYTIRKKNGQKISLQQNMAEGHYNVLDDSYQKTIANSTEEFEFVGVKNGQKVVDETYFISADCCHVKKESGKEVITIQ